MTSSEPSVNRMVELRQAIITAIDEHGKFGVIAAQHNVTWSLVYALAYEPDSYAICSKCSGSGKVTGKSGPGWCEDCLGAGCKSVPVEA